MDLRGDDGEAEAEDDEDDEDDDALEEVDDVETDGIISGLANKARCNDATFHSRANNLAAASSALHLSAGGEDEDDEDEDGIETTNEEDDGKVAEAGGATAETEDSGPLVTASSKTSSSFCFCLPFLLDASSLAAVSWDSRSARSRAASLSATRASLCARIIEASSMNFKTDLSPSGKKSRMLISASAEDADAMCKDLEGEEEGAVVDAEERLEVGGGGDAGSGGSGGDREREGTGGVDLRAVVVREREGAGMGIGTAWTDAAGGILYGWQCSCV